MHLRWCLIPVLAAAVLLCLIPHGWAAEPPARVGERLRDALDRLAEQGLNVVSTSRVVPNRLRVTVVPDADADLADQARALLRPHGLDLIVLDAGNAYVARAQPTPDAVDIADSKDGQSLIEELVVTSHYRVRRDTRDSNTLDQQDLQTLPSLGRDALRGIDALPGIASNGISARHRFRGGDVDEVLYRLDGIELLRPFHMGDVQSLFSVISQNIVESADVYVAGFPVSMGSRMSGVVDMSLVEPYESFAGGLDVNQVMVSADARGRRGDWSWIGSARYSVLDLSLQMFETDYGTPRFHDEFARVQHSGANHDFVAGVLSSSDRISVMDSREAGRNESDYRVAWLRWMQMHGPALESVWQVSGIEIDNRRAGRVQDPAMSVGDLMERRSYEELQISNAWTWGATEGTDVRAGWTLSYQEGDFASRFAAVYGTLGAVLQGVAERSRELSVDREGHALQAYLEATHQWSPRLTVTGGLRFDGQDIDPVHVNEFSARLSATLALNEALKLALDAGRYTQQQHYYEVQIDEGKAELDPPQHADQVNLSLIWTPGDRARLRMDVYTRRIDDPWSHYENLYNRWVLFPELQGDRVPVAPTAARVRGIEFSAAWNPGDSSSWYAHYAYGEARERYGGREHQRPWEQAHTLKGGWRWRSPRWRFGLAVTYRSGWPTTGLITQSVQVPDCFYRDNLPPYVSLDAHVSRVFQVPRGTFEVYLDATNLTNRENTGGYHYAQDQPRKAQYLLPAIPVLGVAWRW